MERYGRRRYKLDFIKFLVYAHASLLECMLQLATTGIPYKEIPVEDLLIKYDKLGAKIFSFINYIEIEWKS